MNTEAMRKGGIPPGLHTNLNLDVGLVAGNSELLLIKSTFRLDHLRGSSHTFLVGSFQQGRQGPGDTLFIDKGFVHLRRTQSLDGRLCIEGFVQKEFNEFIRLKDRNLAGGGLRIRWLESGTGEKETPLIKLYTGLGFMWEQERLKGGGDPLTDLIRSTNYVVLRWEPDARLLFQVTTYFQVDVKGLSDHRVLMDGGLSFALTGKLSAVIKLNARYDHEPPVDVKNYDIELTNGLSFMF